MSKISDEPRSQPAGARVKGRDIYECANQLGGYVGPDTDDALAHFLLRESAAAVDLADEIVQLRSALEPQQEEAVAWRVRYVDQVDGWATFSGKPEWATEKLQDGSPKWVMEPLYTHPTPVQESQTVSEEMVERGADAIYGTRGCDGRAVTMSKPDARTTAHLVLTAALVPS